MDITDERHCKEESVEEQEEDMKEVKSEFVKRHLLEEMRRVLDEVVWRVMKIKMIIGCMRRIMQRVERFTGRKKVRECEKKKGKEDEQGEVSIDKEETCVKIILEKRKMNSSTWHSSTWPRRTIDLDDLKTVRLNHWKCASDKIL